MPSFTFTDTIPAPNNSPSSDQPKMLINNISTKAIIGVDHYTFGSLNSQDGWHKQVTLPVPVPFAIPASLAGQAVIYSNTAGQTQLFSTTDGGAQAYQLTRMIDASITLFGTNTAYPTGGPLATTTGGWTFLPGGLIMQYGLFNPGASLPNSGIIKFPISFTSIPFNIQATFATLNALTQAPHVISIPTDQVSNSQFKYKLDGSSSLSGETGMYWTAIGK